VRHGDVNQEMLAWLDVLDIAASEAAAVRSTTASAPTPAAAASVPADARSVALAENAILCAMRSRDSLDEAEAAQAVFGTASISVEQWLELDMALQALVDSGCLAAGEAGRYVRVRT
jgi:hypothetical protein